MSIADKLTTIAENVPKVYDAGKKAAGGDFWEKFQQEGLREDYDYAFGGIGWNPNNFKPEYVPMRPNRAVGMFQKASNLGIDISEIVDFSGCSAISNTFNESGITKVGTINATINTNGNLNFVFLSARKLKTIEKIIVSGNTGYTQAFDNCASLEDVTFEGIIGADISFKSSPKLTAESIISVVEALSKSVSGKTVTFKQSAIDSADWSTTNYASWDALKATKTNWTFKNENGTVI